MSRYSPIWEALKANKICHTAVPPKLHKRVIKAVIRTKDEDTIFKLESSLAHKKYTLEYKVTASMITFKLKETLKITALLEDTGS